MEVAGCRLRSDYGFFCRSNAQCELRHTAPGAKQFQSQVVVGISCLIELTSLERDRLTPSVSQMTDAQLSLQKAQSEESVLRSLVESGRVEPMLERLMESD